MPNQDISLNNYDPDLAKILRQQQYAQSLRDQSQEAIPINSYNGIQAPISPFSILAKALQGYSARKYAEQSDKQFSDLQTKRGQDLANILRGQYQKPGMPAQGVGMPSITPEPGSITDPLLGNSSPITFPTTRADPTQGAISNAQAPRPTTPQEQLDSATQLFSSSNPQARALAPQFYQTALQKQQVADIAGTTPPEGVSPMAWKAALASGDIGEIGKLAQSGMPQKPSAETQAKLDAFKTWSMNPKNTGKTYVDFENENAGTKAGLEAKARMPYEEKLIQDRMSATQQRYNIPKEDAGLINAAMLDGRLDPNRLNSRTAQIYAQMLRLDPSADLVTPAGIARMKQNPQVQMKVMTAATIKPMLENLRNVVNQLDYSNLKVIGGIKKWWLGQSNDPTLAKYGPVRNDLILKITSAMRGIGMSDKATELEDKVNSETMSPKAIVGYIDGQLESLQPMLDMYGGIALRSPGIVNSGLGGSGATPPPPPVANIAPAGTKANGPGGKVLTSDGKGGWN